MFSPVLALMRRFNIPETRENYLDIAYCGKPPAEDADGYLDGEVEENLPEQFQRDRLAETISEEEQ